MAKIMFIKPALETDAIWDPVRTCVYSGMWYLASKLKEHGHQVRCLDEVVRSNGLQKRNLFQRTLIGDVYSDRPLVISYAELQKQKMRDYASLSPREFAEKYSAFREEGVISRTMARTGNSEEETLQEVARMSPDFVGIPLIATANYLPAISLGRKIKEHFPRTKIMFGGQHVSAMPEQFLAENGFVDFVFTGDAISSITGVIEGRTADKIVRGRFQPMTNFPLLDPEVIEGNNYPAVPNYTYPTDGRKYVDFMFSKGCFRRCDFCVAGSQKGNHVTAEDYDRVDKQLGIFRVNGIEELVVQDDAFLWDKQHIREHLPRILGLMKKHGFFWQNNGGLEFEALNDFVTEQLIKYNSHGRGRVTSLYIPFNPRGWNKDKSAARTMSQRFHQHLENLKKLRGAGVYVFTSTIIGTPEQTREAFDEELQTDRELIQQGYIDAALCLSATMLPGTRWFDLNGHNIVNKKDYPGYSLFTTHHKTDFMSPTEIEEAMIKWLKGLDDVQKTYFWQTAFPNTLGGNQGVR